MSRLYLCRDREDSKLTWVAKECAPEDFDPERRDQVCILFRQEAALLGRLLHRNLPWFVDEFEENGRLYIIMEYVRGHALNEIASPRQIVAAIDWGIQLCDVVGYLHSQEPPVIHRDLKPQNMILDSNGVVKLLDLGIARTFKPGKKGDTALWGSQEYAPPEQVLGLGQTGPDSDTYSLGASIYFFLTARVPNPMRAPEQGELRRLNATIPSQLEDIVSRSMRRERHKRYQSTSQMETELRECLQSLRLSLPTPIWTCPFCSGGNRMQSRFCRHCGRPMVRDAPKMWGN